jgi:hypothetical protein
LATIIEPDGPTEMKTTDPGVPGGTSHVSRFSQGLPGTGPWRARRNSISETYRTTGNRSGVCSFPPRTTHGPLIWGGKECGNRWDFLFRSACY